LATASIKSLIGYITSIESESSGSSPSRKVFAPGFETVHLSRDRTCVLQQSSPVLGECRGARAAIKQGHAELPFEIRQRLADDGLRPPKFAARGREAALLGGGDEGTKLIQGYGIEHDLSPNTMISIE
jgi:hypothetical protein